MTWIGLRKFGGEGGSVRWTWTDGTPGDFLKFAPGRPHRDGNYNCIQLHSDFWAHHDVRQTEMWFDISCNQHLRNFVCKKPADK